MGNFRLLARGNNSPRPFAKLLLVFGCATCADDHDYGWLLSNSFGREKPKNTHKQAASSETQNQIRHGVNHQGSPFQRRRPHSPLRQTMIKPKMNGRCQSG